MSGKVVNFLCSNRKGGLENAFLNLSRALQRLDYRVEHWLPADSPHFDANTIAFNPRGYYDFREMLRIRRYLKAERPRLIITHNSRATFVIGLATIGLGIPHLAFSHGYKTKRFKRAKHIVVLTEHMKKHFEKRGFAAKMLHILPNMPETLPDLHEYTPPSQKIRLGFIGRFTAEKGLPDLLDAFALLRQKHALDVELHLAGGSELKERKLDAGVKLHGWVPDSAVLLSQIDLLVLPSTEESFGLVVLEAAAFGCPVVATRTPGAASQITDGVDGWLAEVGNPEHLAERIAYAISQKADWPLIRERAYERAKGYSMEALLPKLAEILTAAVEA